VAGGRDGVLGVAEFGQHEGEFGMHGGRAGLGAGQAFQRGVGLAGFALAAFGGTEDEQSFGVVGHGAQDFGCLALGERGRGEQGDGLADGFPEGGGGQAGGAFEGQEGRMFFFEKKNQKTFVYWCALPATARQHAKSFLLLFFSKKKFFLPS
jgi:hypothetical protein